MNCEMLAEARLLVVNPDTVRVPFEFDRPEPKRLLNDEPLIRRFVVEAVAKEE